MTPGFQAVHEKDPKKRKFKLYEVEKNGFRLKYCYLNTSNCITVLGIQCPKMRIVSLASSSKKVFWYIFMKTLTENKFL